MDTLIAISPIALLIILMTKKKSMASHIALPLVALVLYALHYFYFNSDLTLMNATVINGFLTAWTPILVIWGAIFLFETMEHTGAMKTIRQWLNNITKNKVAQLMIVGWAFAFLIEGASGFGTPAALAAPVLVGLGFKPVRIAILALIMNSVPVTFGAIGLPTWFGMGELNLSSLEIMEIGIKSASIHFIAALIIPIIALKFIVSWREIKENIGYIYLSILSCTIPYLLIAFYSYEFPSIIGGMVGLSLSVLFAKWGLGLKKESSKKKLAPILKASFPLWGTVLLLIITRFEPFGLKQIITSTLYHFTISLQPFADIMISSALVIQLKNILGTGVNFVHQTLYIPFFIPFFLISFITFLWFKSGDEAVKNSWIRTWQRMRKPILALSGALVFVKLLMMGGDQALTILIGQSLANLTGNAWQFFASYLGALGAFFAGSNTVSNLTFGGIQMAIAQSSNLNLTMILAMQSVGGAMGNMVCINNIVAVCAVLGLTQKEGFILKRTFIPMVIYGVIAGVIGIFLI